MLPAWLPGVASAIGSFFTNKSNKKINQQNLSEQRRINEENRMHAERMAQNSILWRVEDAKRAGVHPLFALGSQPFMPSTSYAGVQSPSDYSGMGQDISRALEAVRSQQERGQNALLIAQAADAARVRMGLENELLSARIEALRSETARNQAVQVGPPSPTFSTSELSSMGGAGLSPRVQPQPSQPVISARGNPAREAGNITDYAFTRTPTGLAVVPSRDVKERTEDNIITETQWALRNQLFPMFRGLPAPSTRDFPLPQGYVWRWDAGAQEFRPVSVLRRQSRMWMVH